MKAGTIVEAGLFGTLALLAHAAAFVVVPGPGAAVASGEEGTALMSLEAAAPSYVAMVERFDNPPLPSLPQLQPFAPPRLDLPPLPPLPALDVAALPLPRFDAPPPPEVQTPPAPQPKPQPKPPKPVPKRQASPAADKPPPAAKPAARASDGVAAQRAAGAGGGAQAGLGGQDRAASVSEGRQRDLRAQWGAQIRARIERRKLYPSAAGRVQGAVKVQLSIAADGALASVRVVGSSGHAALDEAALRAVQRAGRFPAAPKELTEARHGFALTIEFTR
ncbi:MAG: energy transducer TonB [Paracoccaceae bacterium]